ncbi:response regulator receiver protein [Hyphomonas adhaerens MHS-3]|uniref:Response regulator receiver protein n=1 Tax=Hyphomonas adhaerens MHS-3 TaxID=1280949 RepID=A0A069E3M5_9PROT|nr:response regulator [Hyphomonas adhaerens]KCZ84567.1 response regulator receiver protein [Hyphomonas adhaerens MHS-3]
MTSGGCAILLVEDEFLIALDVQMRLQEAGYNVLDPVASVEEAMSVLDKTPVCAAILDMNIRGSTSLPIAQRLQAEGKPFIFLSGNDTYQLQEKYSDRSVLTKPIDYAQLIGELRELCGF